MDLPIGTSIAFYLDFYARFRPKSEVQLDVQTLHRAGSVDG